MSRHSYYVMRDRRFRSYYQEFGPEHELEPTFREVRDRVDSDVVDFDLVGEGMTGPYYRLIDAIHALVSALFEIYPNGYARIEVTIEGLRLRFVTKRGIASDVHTLIDVGWVYSNAEEVCEAGIRFIDDVAKQHQYATE